MVGRTHQPTGKQGTCHGLFDSGGNPRRRPESVYANYLKTCAMSGVEPVSRERALGLIQEWTEVLSGRPETTDALAQRAASRSAGPTICHSAYRCAISSLRRDVALVPTCLCACRDSGRLSDMSVRNASEVARKGADLVPSKYSSRHAK